jgi:hypothetical protein
MDAKQEEAHDDSLLCSQAASLVVGKHDLLLSSHDPRHLKRVALYAAALL